MLLRRLVFGVALAALLSVPLAAQATSPDDILALLLGGGEPAPAPPHCVHDEAEPHVLLLYARPFDAPDTYVESIALIREQANTSNGILVAAGAEHGWEFRLPILCGPDGLAIVREAVLPTPGAVDSLDTIRADLSELGLRDGAAKLMLSYNGAVGSYGGQGEPFPDDRPGPENLNNGGGTVSVMYSTTRISGWLWLHELFHSMGAVQDSAPHSTGRAHCNDGSDVLCEVDGGPRSDYQTVCGKRKLDCNSDDYFHPEPMPGSYLATHWNLASPNNSYLYRAKLPPAPPLLPIG